MTAPYGAQQSLKKIYAAQPEQSATPNYLAEQFVGKVSAQEAKDQGQREVRGAETGLKEKTLATHAELFTKKLGMEQQQFDVNQDINEQAFQLEQQVADWQKDLARKATVFAGVKTALNITGAWWADKQADKLIGIMVGQRDKLDKIMELWTKEKDALVAQHRTGTLLLSPKESQEQQETRYVKPYQARESREE